MVDNVRIEETLSALMDSETQEFETRRVLKEMSRDSELRDTWHRYQLASAAMKRDLPGKMVDLSSSIGAALENEPAHKPGLGALLQPLGKVAIAASVALVAVLGVQQMQPDPSVPATAAPQVASGAGDSGSSQFQLPAGVDLPPIGARTVSAGPQYEEPQVRPTLTVSRRQLAELKNEAQLRDYLNTIMEQHTRNAAGASANQGSLPLGRLPQTQNQ